jgi:hypothetical protein
MAAFGSMGASVAVDAVVVEAVVVDAVVVEVVPAP